jgi:hypothetical protein
MGVAQRDLFAASEDPGAFTLQSTEEWLAGTIVVPPDFALQALGSHGPLPVQQQVYWLLGKHTTIGKVGANIDTNRIIERITLKE